MNPDSPSTTVSVVRVAGNNLDYLTLGDSPIMVWQPGRDIQVVMDGRTAHLPGGRPYTFELVRSLRNKPGGFWIASTVPEAAYEAITGTVELHPGSEIALLTDGVTRLVEFYDYTWDRLFGQLRESTPKAVIASVRKFERERGTPYGKPHDDATAMHITHLIDQRRWSAPAGQAR
jgi:serine/threonine protein phosphatase PrpC